MQEPIILVADDGASVFRTKEEAERFTEAVDIKGGVYAAAYDASGCLLRLHPALSYSRYGGGALTRVDPPEDRSADAADALRVMLGHIASVRRVDFDPALLATCSLRELVGLSVPYFRQ